MNEIIPVSGIVRAVINADEAVKAFNDYQQLAEKIQLPEDIQKIKGKDFRKKSFWRKIQRFFNLNIEIVKEERIQYEKYFTYFFTVRAIAPNGIHCDGTGACSSNETGLVKTEHNTRAIAETRAKNRAIADLCAFGEVSAEEIIDDDPPKTKPYNQAQAKQEILNHSFLFKESMTEDELNYFKNISANNDVFSKDKFDEAENKIKIITERANNKNEQTN